VILDANVEPRPDVISLADEAAEGPMAVFRGIAAACEASLVADRPEDRCPMAPFMAEKVHDAINGNDNGKRQMLEGVFNYYSSQKDVPCAGVMMSCMSWIMKGGGPKPAGCNSKIGHYIEAHMQQTGSGSTLQLSDAVTLDSNLQLSDAVTLDREDHEETERASARVAAASASKTVVQHGQHPYTESARDHLGFAGIFSVVALDTHGRLTEPALIQWWKDAAIRFTVGLGRATQYAVGVSIWPAIATPVPPAGDSKLTPLVIGNLRDLQTSYLATQRMKQGFPQGHLLTFQGYGHGILGGSKANKAAEDACYKHVEDYLFHGILPRDGTNCLVITTAKVSEADAERQAPSC